MSPAYSTTWPVLPESPVAELYPPDILHRGQFVLGRRFPRHFTAWTRYPVADGLVLAAHPELFVTQVARAGAALTLIGYLLDPDDPEADDKDILTRLLPACSSVTQLLAATSRLGGRWALVAMCGDGVHLFTDPLGLRQVHFAAPVAGADVWALSQPGLAIDALGMEVDPAALEFIDSYAFRAFPEYRWPGFGAPVHGLRHLLPNHVLDLKRGIATRYWPDQALPRLGLDEAVERMTRLLRGLILAAGARYELALSLTAGIDSRLALAASREIRERLCYVTVRQARMADGAADLWVPARLLAKLGLRHEIIRARGSMSADFSWAFKRSAFLAHDHYGPDAEAILAHFERRKVAVTGSGGEVGRCSFRAQLPWSAYRRITAADLARLQHMDHPYAIERFEEWLADAQARANVKLLDLFEWEQGHGNWLAATQLEFDMAWRDIFTPYNCRALLVTLLAVDERLRRAPDYLLFNRAIRQLWPELLSEPINPGRRCSVLARCRSLLRHTWELRPSAA